MTCVAKLWVGALAGGYLQVATALEAAQPTLFEPRFLRPGSDGEADLRAFSLPARVQPGEYSLQVKVNQQALGRLLIPYRIPDGSDTAQACFDRPLLRRLGVKLEALPALEEGCHPLQRWMAEAQVALDFPEQRLALDIPQAWQVRTPAGQVSPQLWESGVTSAFSGYDLALFDVDGSQVAARTQAYAGLTSGLNLGNWQWRHQANLSTTGGYQALNHYVQRELAPWGAQLRLGQLSTPGDLLDAQQIRGMHLFSDDRMLPASQRGFAPLVRGVARGNARVAIRQGERLLREVVVPPGPFVIDDLYAASQGGDLQVTVNEADGSQQHFTVTNAAAPLALRQGQSRFGLSLGELHASSLPATPWFAQGTWQQGFNDVLTGYTGATVADDYQQLLLGSALNTPVGAVGLDVARARADSGEGERVRLSYSTLLAASDTRLGASYQQATSPGYQSLADAYRTDRSAWRERNRASFSASQPLGTAWGQLNASAWAASGWAGGADRRGYTLSYAHRFGALGYALSASRERDRQGSEQTLMQLSLSLPLGGSRGSLTAGLNHSAYGSQAQAGYRNGTEHYHYGATVSASERSDGARVNAFGSWREPFAEFNGSVAQGQGSRQLSLGARGAAVAHAGGVTLSQPLSETFAIVQVPDAAGARLVNGNQVRVDRQGHAIVPNLVPYQLNRVEVDPKGLPLEVELAINSQQVVPRAGATPLLRYPTRSGRTALIELRLADGGTLPFGAQVADSDGTALGVVGQASQVLARGLQPQGQLRAQWGEHGEQQCVASYDVGEAAGALQRLSVICQPGQGEAR